MAKAAPSWKNYKQDGRIVRRAMYVPHVGVWAIEWAGGIGAYELTLDGQFHSSHPSVKSAKERPASFPVPCETRYPELYDAAKEAARAAGRKIDEIMATRKFTKAGGDTPYKSQAILEMAIKILQNNV